MIGRQSFNSCMGKYYVYILCNDRKNVLYVGATSDLKKRLYFHKKGLISGFTKKYNVRSLVYYETFDSEELAYKKENALKKTNRQRKINLVNSFNPLWNDLVGEFQ